MWLGACSQESVSKNDFSPKSDPYKSFRGFSFFPDHQFITSWLVDFALFFCWSEHFGGKHIYPLLLNMFSLFVINMITILAGNMFAPLFSVLEGNMSAAPFNFIFLGYYNFWILPTMLLKSSKLSWKWTALEDTGVEDTGVEGTVWWHSYRHGYLISVLTFNDIRNEKNLEKHIVRR